MAEFTLQDGVEQARPLRDNDPSSLQHVPRVAMYRRIDYNFLTSVRLHAIFERMSEHDSLYLDTLTGDYNKRYLNEVQKDTITELITSRVPLSIVWIDIDHFKEINDTHGHMKGDEVTKDLRIS